MLIGILLLVFKLELYTEFVTPWQKKRAGHFNLIISQAFQKSRAHENNSILFELSKKAAKSMILFSGGLRGATGSRRGSGLLAAKKGPFTWISVKRY